MSSGPGMRGVGLDHADQAMAVGHRVVDHREIARLEDVERHLPARQQQRAGQRKHRNHVRQIGRPAIDHVHRHCRSPDPTASDRTRRSASTQTGSTTSLRRPLTVASSVGPHASKNWTSCLRAPSSFHLRSRLTMLEQMIGRLLALACRIERDREIESRLMVERIRGDFLFKLADRADRLRLLGDFERRARRHDRGIVALGLGHQRERLLRLLDRAGLHIGAREAGERRHAARLLLQHLGVELDRLGGVAGRERRVGGLQQILRLAAELVLGDALDEVRDLALGQRAEEAVGRLAVDEGDHGRDRLDAHLARNGRMLVDVHLDQLDLALGGLDGLLQHRGELLARPAPLGPEIDQHRLALRFLDHVLHEGLRGGVLDEAVGRCRCRPRDILQHRVLFLEVGPSAPEP